MNFEQVVNATSEAFLVIQSVVSSANYSLILVSLFDTIKHASFLVSEHLVSSPIAFTELQLTLLSVFSTIIFVNLLLIAYYWSKYGGVITDRFIRPSTLKEIEELKLSVAKLKLPYEHTPRI